MIEKNWKELVKPSKLDVQTNDDKSYAKITIEPLEKGFALTLGNALRRILLSSIQGTAVTAIQIDGVVHEFSSINGIREDVTDIVLNIKGLSLKLKNPGPKKLILDAQGPGEIKAKDLKESADIEILNPDQVICNLDDNTKIYIELTVNTGKGYVSAEKNRANDSPLGLIPIDSVYSPVKRVSYNVSETREGLSIDYDKLTMEVETNGSVEAEDCVAYAARILQDQLGMFINFEEPKEIVGRIDNRFCSELSKIPSASAILTTSSRTLRRCSIVSASPSARTEWTNSFSASDPKNTEAASRTISCTSWSLRDGFHFFSAAEIASTSSSYRFASVE